MRAKRAPLGGPSWKKTIGLRPRGTQGRRGCRRHERRCQRRQFWKGMPMGAVSGPEPPGKAISDGHDDERQGGAARGGRPGRTCR